jgi:hypothetical protein
MNKIILLITVALLFVLAVQHNGCGSAHQKADTVIAHDTTWETHDSLIVKKMKVTNTIYETVPPEYIADTNYPRLKAQYDSLVRQYLAKNIYADTVKLDTLGYVAVADTVQKDLLQGRSYKYNYKIPTITNTVTITKYAPATSHLYLGGGINGNKTLGVTGVQGGLLYETKSNKVFGLNIGSTINSQIVYGFNAYWKLK